MTNTSLTELSTLGTNSVVHSLFLCQDAILLRSSLHEMFLGCRMNPSGISNCRTENVTAWAIHKEATGRCPASMAMVCTIRFVKDTEWSMV